MKILLIEDDDLLIQVLTRSLAPYHYIVDAVRDGEMGWTYGSTFEYDLIVLDVVLPKLDGISLCKRFRAEGYLTPILLLTAQDTITTKVQGFDAGADDYVVKPFNPTELTARIRALLRRGSMNPSPLLSCGDLLLNLSTCEVSYRGEPLTLTTKEYELLELLLREGQHVFSSEELLDRLWSSEAFPSEATVRSHIRRLRQKLVAIGAPSDLIATMHGRGYYLKAAGKEEAAQRSAQSGQVASSRQVASSDRPTNQELAESQIQNSSRSPAVQQQYLAFLNETWLTTKPKSLSQVAVLAQAVNDLQADRLNAQQQAQAQRVAHQLAGTLGILGLAKAMHLARQLEHWLGSHDSLQPKQAPLIRALVTALQQTIAETTQIEMSQILQENTPLLLAISSDAAFNQTLANVAATHGIRFDTLRPEAVQALLAAEDGTDIAQNASLFVENQQPDVLLFRFPLYPTEQIETAQLRDEFGAALSTLQSFARRYPNLPILVIGDRSKLNHCLEVMRRGGRLFLDSSTPPDQVVATVVKVLRDFQKPTKVMIVDDDHTWLRTLPTLLKPWGFTVTTLADPEQFWTVLQDSTPDALVLDVKMPQIDGFELCQILRSDPNWQRLPVLFLSVLSDSASQNQAFTVGADDYLCKPVKGVELANRILSRLQRVRAWAS